MDHLLRATARAEAEHFWFRGFRYFVTPLLRQATAGCSNARLLDCGCGTGANLDLLGQFGRAYGFDLTASGLQFGRSAGRTRLARASMAAIPFPSNAFDVVTSFDVFVALPVDVERQSAAEMYRVVRPGGCTVVNVAATESLRGDHSVLSREVRRYSLASLTRLMTSAGFLVERITYSNATLFVPMYVVRALQRRRGLMPEERADRDIRVPARPLNALAGGVLWLESLWLRRFDSPFGSSLLCLARKPRSPHTRTT